MSIPVPIAITSASNGTLLYVNKLFAGLMSATQNQLIGKVIQNFFSDEKTRRAVIDRFQEQSIVLDQQVTLQLPDFTHIRVSINSRPFYFKNQLGILSTIHNISRLELQLQRTYSVVKRHELALQASQVGIWSWDFASNRIVWDNIMHSLFGIERGKFSGTEKEYFDFIHPDDRELAQAMCEHFRTTGGQFDFKLKVLKPNGEIRIIVNRGEAYKNKQNITVRIVGACWDVTENISLMQRLEHQAIHDPLTGLLNRFELQRRMAELLEYVKEDRSEHAFCYFDVDRFQVINDTSGHDAGDELLQNIAELLTQYVKKSDSLARMGSDEFGLLIKNCNMDEARKITAVLHKAVDDFYFEWERKVFDVSISMGLVPVNREQTGVAMILGAADAALGAAKDAGRNRIHEYRPQDSTMIRRQGEMQWVVELESALREDRFQLFFQPIHAISRKEEGLHFEVLLRVVGKDGDLGLPGDLLQAAEQFHMANRVDRWVINSMFDWLKNNPEICAKLSLCSINLSGLSIADAEFATFLKAKLEELGPVSSCISFEITENAAIKNLKRARNFIDIIKQCGCKFSLDDFGSGLSSFAYLKNLPVDYLKIDGQFVRNVADEPVNYAMVKAICDVGKVLGMQVIAEYVETEACLNKLKEIGVDYGQGHYYGKTNALDQVIVVDPTIAEST